LEQQKAAIERALSALREVDGVGGVVTVAAVPAPAASGSAAKATRKGGMTPEGRKRLSEALRQRWAAKKASESEAATPKKRGRKAKAA